MNLFRKTLKYLEIDKYNLRYVLLCLICLICLLLGILIYRMLVNGKSVDSFSGMSENKIDNSEIDKIIVPDLIGGIGNQLFVYVSALVLSKMYNIPLVLDNRKDIYSYGANRSTYNDTIFYNVKHDNDLNANDFTKLDTTLSIDEGMFKSILENRNELDKKMVNKKILYVTGGYYQEYSYFNKYREDILEILRPNKDINDKVDRLFEKHGIKPTDKLVGVHIRLLDIYTPDTPEKRVYDEEEYDFLISDLDKFPKELKFIVLSNDVNECKIKFNARNIPIDKDRLIYISDKDYVELAILSRCNDYIASPSTFCWWGIYLNPSRIDEKKIYIYWKQDSDYRQDFYKKYEMYPNLINK